MLQIQMAVTEICRVMKSKRNYALSFTASLTWNTQLEFIINDYQISALMKKTISFAVYRNLEYYNCSCFLWELKLDYHVKGKTWAECVKYRVPRKITCLVIRGRNSCLSGCC